MRQFFKTPLDFQNPISRYLGTYGIVFAVILWANYIFMHYRITGNIIFSIMPVVGMITMYLWLILLADEFLDLLGSYGSVALIIKKAKMITFMIIALYGFLALALWVNRVSYQPAVIKTTRIVSMTYVNMGAVNYRYLTVKSWDHAPGTQNLLLAHRDERGLYAGADIEILMRKGILSLKRILEIRRDMESYYLKMLKAAPDSKVGMGGLVNLYSKRNEFEKASKWYDQLFEKYPDETAIGIDLGGRLVEGRRYKKAADIFKKVLEMRRDYEVLYMLGYALAWAGEKYEAEKYLLEATELDPTDFRAFYSLGYVYRDTGKYARAKEAWTKVLELMPNFPEVENNIKSIERYTKKQ